MVSFAKLKCRDSETCGLASCAQKLEPVSKGNGFEVLDLRPAIKIDSA